MSDRDDGLAQHDVRSTADQRPTGLRPTRRSVLKAGMLSAVGIAAGGLRPPRSAAAAAPMSFSGASPIRAAMHVHAAWSEGPASWEAQFAQARSLAMDVVYLTDHDFRALAYRYMPSLAGITMVESSTGSFAQKAAANNNGVVRLLAESGSSTAPAALQLAVQTKPQAVNQLRTSISGQSLRVAFPSCRIDAGGKYEIALDLSNHPAHGSRPAGQYRLRYRFGAYSPHHRLDSTGLTGIVTNPSPAPGSTITLTPVEDVAVLWPDMVAMDNSSFMLTLVATSPRRNVVVDVSAGVTFTRARNDQLSLISDQRSIINAYKSEFPGLTVHPTVEISRLDPHCIPFGVPQFFPPQSAITPTSHDAYYKQMVADVHSQGGLVSWNHPFGADDGPLQSAAQQASRRRSIFDAMMANGRFGTDILEVGYQVRGFVDTQTHLDLWDTFSRWAVFLTGNGVNDDHQGTHWSTLTNGFTTGLWAQSAAHRYLTPALAAGRVFTYHAGKFPGAQLDMLVDDTVAMGKVSVRTVANRTLAINAGNLPSGSSVEVVQGPVDYSGNDPMTTVVARLPATQFSGSGTASVSLDTSASCFARAQVRNSAGSIVGIGNPIWMLRSTPPNGIPPSRAG